MYKVGDRVRTVIRSVDKGDYIFDNLWGIIVEEYRLSDMFGSNYKVKLDNGRYMIFRDINLKPSRRVYD